MADAFARSVARVVVTKICESMSFEGVQNSAVDTLSDIMLRYISEVGAASHEYAELAGRFESNLNDVLLALEDLGTSADSLMLYVDEADEIPFPSALPSFPIRKRPRHVTPSFRDKGEDPPQAHIPEWLPALPDQHTYVATPSFNARPTDPQEDKLKLGKERRQAQKSLMTLHKRTHEEDTTLGSRKLGSDPWGSLGVHGDEQAAVLSRDGSRLGSRRAAAAAAANPFLAQPEPAGQASEPPPKVPSILEAFAPALRESDAHGDARDDDVAPLSVLQSRDADDGREGPSKEGRGQELLPEENERNHVLFAFGMPDKARGKGLAAKSGLPSRDRREADRRKQVGRKAINEDADKRRRVEAIFAKAETAEQGRDAQDGPANRRTDAEVI